MYLISKCKVQSLNWPNQLRILLLEMNIASKNDFMNKELEIKLLLSCINILFCLQKIKFDYFI